MRIYKTTEIKKLMLPLIFAVAFSSMVLIFPKEAISGAKDGLQFCGNVLVPSLFPFMIISSFAVNSGICNLLEKPLDKITKMVFRLPGSCGTTIFLSLFGGFPIGARGISALYREKVINHQQAEQMAYFCVCSGPGFLITFVGSYLYDNIKTGMILLISAVLAVIAVGVITGVFSKHKSYENCIENKKIITENFSLSLTKSVSDASKGIIEMCAMVILFNVLIAFGKIIISDGNILKLFYILTEVTTACNELAGNTSAVIIAFAIGFGGLCVHFQIFQALGEIKINKLKFFLFRIMQGILTALFAKIGFYFFPVTQQVFSNTQNTTAVISSSTYIGSIALILTAVCFLYSMKSYDKN